MRRIKPLKKILLGVSSFFIVFLAGTQEATAVAPLLAIGAVGIVGGLLGWIFGGGVEAIAKQIIEFLAGLIVGLIQFLVALFVQVAGALIEFAIKLNGQVADSSIVSDGYKIMLSVANIALVIAIITVAFMVMLRRSGANQLLIRFLAVALIINFGYYIIINLLIKPVDNITLQINNAIDIHPEGGFAAALGDSLLIEEADPTPIINSSLESSDQGGDLSFLTTAAISLTRIIFIGTAGFIITITMFAYAFMLMARYVALSFFIILFPLAIVFWMFPNLKVTGGNLWDQWLQGFTRWLLFAPIGLFFIWFGIKLITDSNVLQSGTSETEIFFASVGNIIVVVGFLLGGLMVANKMSITGAKYADGIVKKAGEKAKAYAKKEVIKTGSAPLRTKAGRLITGGLQRGWDRNKLTRFITAPIRPLGSALSVARQKGEALYKEDKAKVDRLSLEEQSRRVAGASDSERLAILTNIRREFKQAQESFNTADDALKRAIARNTRRPGSVPADTLRRLQQRLNREQQRRDKAIGLLGAIPADIQKSFDRLNRSYGQHQTPTPN